LTNIAARATRLTSRLWRVNRDFRLATGFVDGASGKTQMHPHPGADSANFLKLRLSALAIELAALVDEMEAEWREKGALSEQSAQHLHDLLGRAERVFADPIGAMANHEMSEKN
jgi:hypothetical protein